MPHATPEGTRNYFAKHAQVPHTVLGKTGWSISPVGFGGYRIHDSSETHKEALRQALMSGCNLIDTSTNYTDGGSERLVGQVLADLLSAGLLARQEVVVVSKAGYIQGQNLELARKNPFPEQVKYTDDCWHSISPGFLQDQITRSLERLKLTQLDVLLLHNPEYYLKAGGAHEEYYRRIEKASEHLETEVKSGRIGNYGISSNTFPAPSDSPEFTSLERVQKLAGPHFAVIQFPFNLYESGAVLEKNCSGQSIADFSRGHRLGTLINRPLNAFHQNRLVRLADFPAHEGVDTLSQLQQSLEEAMNLELKYPGAAIIPAHKISWGHILRANLKSLGDLDSWHGILDYQIFPAVRAQHQELLEHEETREWTEAYQEVLIRLLEAMSMHLEQQAGYRSQEITRLLVDAEPELKTSATLSQKCIRLYRSTPGIDCVLVGMRRPEYVEDVMALDSRIDAETAISALHAVRSS